VTGVRFELLGAVEVRIDGHLVEAGHARQRCVLAALLVDANRAVPTDQLVERVWGGQLPQRARNTLSGYLSRLRGLLAGAGDVAITREPTGYLLTVDPAAVDLHRFRQLVAEARGHPAAATAAALLDQALGLWRGEPFATLDTPWLTDVRHALEAERLSVLLDRNDLALGLGRHAGLLAELSGLAAAHPLDERLAGQLMLALYRSGRQAEALHRYQQIRCRLAEELGVDPSPPLQRLHRQILSTDAVLAAPPQPPLLVPYQLPAPPPSFTGRARELAALDAVLAEAGDRPQVAVVTGTAGVGKTALAVHWAHRVAPHFPDGQLYVNLRGFHPTGPAHDAVRGLLTALGVPDLRIPTNPQAQIGLYRSLLAGKRMLVLLDDAAGVDQVRPLLPGAPGCLVVVTSRSQLAGLIALEGGHPVALDLLSAGEARQLLATRLGPARAGSDPAALTELIARCARLPLALAIVAARAEIHPEFPLAWFADELRRAGNGLGLSAGRDAATDVRTVFSWSYRTLGDRAAGLFRLLGLHPGPDIGVPAAASLAGTPEGEARKALGELAQAHLIIEHAPGRYAFHDLLRAYAAELAGRLDGETGRRAAMARLLDSYVHTAHAGARLMQPFRDRIEPAVAEPPVLAEELADVGHAMAWFAAEHAVLLAAVQQAADQGMDVQAWQLSWAMADYLDRAGHWHDWVVTHRTALAAARRLADRQAEATTLRALGRAYAQLGQPGEAHRHLRRALDLCRQLGDRSGLAHSHRGLGWVRSRQGHHRQALRHARRALELFEADGNQVMLGRALNSVGWLYAQLHDERRALLHCQRALALLRAAGDRFGEANTLDSLGFAYHHLGRTGPAIACYRQAVDLFRELGDRYYEADTLSHTGDACLDAGDAGRARWAWCRALDILTQLGHPDARQVRAKLAAACTPPAVDHRAS
jgi:DNA-binding SARP family transcriptional activator/tetratricopeptide (TPR) repeat protein